MKTAAIVILALLTLTLVGCGLQEFPCAPGQCQGEDINQTDITPVDTNIDDVFGDDSSVIPPPVSS